MTGTQAEKGPLRILAIMAHPDDVDYGSAATIARWVEAGHTVTYLVVTPGDAGGFDSTPRAEIGAVRSREQRAAAAILGVSDVRFLAGYHDGEVTVSEGLVRDLVRVIREVRPDRVLAMSPERSWDFIWQSHPDHLATGEATARALYPAAENPFAFAELLRDEGLDPWRVPEIWLQGHPRPNVAIDAKPYFSRKLRALLAHESQMPDPGGLEAMIRNRLAHQPRPVETPDGQLVECFLVPTLHDPPELGHSAVDVR